MFAVIKTGGKQYRVSPADTITVEKLAGEAGDAVSFDHHYEEADTFDEVYRRIVTDLLVAAETHDTILYAVPESPRVLERTVDVHIRKLREKIGEGYIKTLKGVGYMFSIES